ncbi:hypothetical protein F0223_21845 [Vibrio coralliilyticus]|uniref:hypothetical protein n=1 Tax=Vibrio TaxID=662 RepID=UPI0005027ED7|nr:MULTISPECIES: hypothetical protein [Vibrio]KFI12002.1 hypothetical protein IX95_11175 [Vibrio sp. B183]NOI20871.1 hypothetical protein [Vibrio coralliilyticus]
MVIYLELVLLVFPLGLAALTARDIISPKLAKTLLVSSGSILGIEILLSTLIAFNVIDFELSTTSLFIGSEMWNFFLVPALLMLYMYVFTELKYWKSDTKKPR